MRLTLFVALRHLRARLRSTLLITVGVALGVMVMATMASMLLGLQQQFIESIVETSPHVVVEGEELGRPRPPVAVPADADTVVFLSRRPPPEQARGIANYRQVVHRVEAVPGVVAAAPNLTGQALLRYGTRGRPVALTGIVPRQQSRAMQWEKNLRQAQGDLQTNPAGVIVGYELAQELGLPVGARVTLIAGADRRREVRVIALYQSGIRQIDERLVYVNLSLAQSLLDRPSEATQIAVRTHDVEAAPAIADRLEAVTQYRARSWQEVNAVFFGIFRLQNSMTSVMIAFIVIIAGFGIANGLVTLILEKQRDIGILKALGVPARGIAGIFLTEGLLMGAFGGVLGMLLAYFSIAYLDQMTLSGEGELSTADTFTMLRTAWVYLIPATIATTVSGLASLLPVRIAARYDPVEIIRSAK